MNIVRAMRRLPAAIVVAGVLSLPAALAPAQEISPEHLALARQYVELSDQSQIYEIALLDVGLSTVRTLIQQNPALSEPLEPAVDKVIEEYLANKGDLFNQFARIYAARFTVEELQEILDFYQSPVGEKLMRQNPGINVDLDRVMQIWEANLQTEFFSKVRAELRAAGHSV